MFFKFYLNIIKCKNVHFKYYSSKHQNNLKPPWNVLFFGTDKFSLSSLKALNDEYKKQNILQKLEVVTVCTNKLNPVQKFAEQENLHVHKWPLQSVINSFEIGLVVSFGHLIPTNIINLFPLGILNVHASLLPRWRGAAPIIYAIAKGDIKTGVTIMRIKPEKFDIGEIITQEEINITKDETMPILYNKLAVLGAQTLVKSLKNMPDNLYNAKPQTEEGVTYAPRVKPTFANVSWDTMSAQEIYNLSRALTGLYPLSTTWNDIRVKIHNIRICDDKIENKVPGFLIYDKINKSIKVQCADGKWISTESIGVHGKKTMTANDFNNGFIKKQGEDNRLFK